MTIFSLIANPVYKQKYVLERLICLHTHIVRDSLIIHYDNMLDEQTIASIQSDYDRCTIQKIPLDYILGYVEYGGLCFHVNEHTIIPRPETEYMIEAVREYIDHPVCLTDIGTGSGVLGLSVLNTHGTYISQAYMIDISVDALAVATKNYQHCLTQGQIDPSIDVTIQEGNLFDMDIIQPSQASLESEIIIVANLPYIPDETFDTNPDMSIKYEPRVAFVGGDDGLDLYRIMFAQIDTYRALHPTQPITMFLEMMTRQVDILAKEYPSLTMSEIKTFHFQIRIVKVVYTA